MVENEKEFCWIVKLDWLNILNLLDLTSINQIPEYKKEKAIRKLTKMYGSENLMKFEPEYLDELIVKELNELMKKELEIHKRNQEKIRREIRDKFVPLKRGGIIKIDPRDLKDFKGDPEDMLKYLYKKFLGKDDDDNDDDKDKYKEDNTGYYI